MRWLGILLLALASGACGARDGAPAALDRAAAESPVVAHVDGAPIFAAEVAALAARRGLSPRAALDELIGLELLAQEAARRGEPDRDALDARRRAAVQKLLAVEFEQPRPPGAVPRPELERIYRDRKIHFVHGPKRRVYNFLADERPPRPGSPAQERVKQFVAEARGQSIERIKELGYAMRLARPGDPEFVTFEGDAGLVPEFVAASLKLPATVGALSEPFSTMYGWHAVLLLELLPARNTPFEQAIPEILDRVYGLWLEHQFNLWTAALSGTRPITTRPELLAQLPVHSAEPPGGRNP